MIEMVHIYNNAFYEFIYLIIYSILRIYSFKLILKMYPWIIYLTYFFLQWDCQGRFLNN